MANKEVYSLGISIKVNGDGEAKKKISTLESVTEKVEKKFRSLSKLTASPTSKIKDLTTPIVEKIEAKVNKLNNKSISPTARIKDNASSNLDKIGSKVEKLNNKEAKTKVKIQDEATKSLTNIESKISSWTKTIAKKTIAIGLAGAMLVGGLGLKDTMQTYTDFEKQLSSVKAVTSATDPEMQRLKKTALDLGASTAWSASNVADAEQLLGQAGYSVDETITALPGLLSLASAGSLDLASATSIASSTLRGFNLDAGQTTHVADALALTANATNSDVTDLGESLKYISPVAHSLGISMEDAVAATGLLSNQAIVGSQAGTVLRQTMARLASPTKEASELMQKYGINAFDAQGNMKTLSGVVDNLNSSLGGLTNQKRADVISTVFGIESMSGVMALMNQGGQSLSDLTEKLKQANGAAQKMADTKLDNLAGQMENLNGAVETMKIHLGERLAPYAKEFVSWLTAKMPDIENGIMSTVDYVSNHIDEIKTGIEGIVAAIAVVSGINFLGSFGNSLSGISKFISLIKGANVAEEMTGAASGLSKVGLIGRMLPALLSPAGIAVTAGVATTAYAVKKYNDLMAESVTKPTEELGLTERIMNALSGNVNKSKKELQDAGLVYDDFGEGVSDSFKDASREASKNLLQIEMNIKRLTSDGSFSESDVNSFKNYISDFASGAINEMKQKQSDIQKEFQKTFSIDGVTSTAEQGTLDYLNTYFQEGIDKELGIRDEIYQIGDKAIKDHGTLLDSDMELIKDKLSELQAIKLQYANAENAGEQAYASSKFKSAAERVSGIDDVSKLMQDRAKEHQQTIDETKANYDKTIATTQYLMDNESDSNKKATLQKGLDEATTARDKALKQAEEDWKSDLETLYSAYPNAKGKIDEEDGHTFSRSELKSQGVMSKLEDNHKGLSDIKESGAYALRNSVNGNLDTLYVDVDKVTGEIKGIINGATGEIGAYSDKQKESLVSLQQEYSNTGASIQALVGDQARINTTTGAVVNVFGSIVGSLQNVQKETDKTVTGILDINGHSIEITSNADGAITEMHEVSSSAGEASEKIDKVTDSLNDIPPEKTVVVTTVIKQITQDIKEFLKFGDSNSSQEVTEHASGTDYATAGLSTVNERGWELGDRTMPIIGQYNDNPVVNLQRGTKIKNHMDSMSEMKADVKREVANQMPQQKVQVYQPQLAVAGGGNSFSFNMGGININNMADKAAIIKQATQEFAKQLMEVLNNQA